MPSKYKVKSLYFEKFKKLTERGLMKLRYDTVLVEILPEEEVTTEAGILLASDPSQARGGISEHRATVAIVLAIGAGYWDADKAKYIPLDSKPGDIIMMPKYSASDISVFPGIQEITSGRLALVKDSQIFTEFPGDTYSEAREVLGE